MCRLTDDSFHARSSAHGRRYTYVLLESAVRPRWRPGRWLDVPAAGRHAMRQAAEQLLGEHDFSAFRSSECQAATAVKTLRSLEITGAGLLEVRIRRQRVPAPHGAQI